MSLIKQLRNPRLINRQYLRDEVDEYTSDGDLIDYFGPQFRSRIKTYSQLSGFSDLDKLLKKKTDFGILLIENEPGSGHWIAILKYGDIAEFFNSYGEAPGYEVKNLEKSINSSLNQSANDITRLLDIEVSKGRKVIYNKKKLQKLKFDIATCGKHCILRCIMLKYFNMDLLKYLSFIEKMCKHLKLTPDEFVTLMIEI